MASKCKIFTKKRESFYIQEIVEAHEADSVIKKNGIEEMEFFGTITSKVEKEDNPFVILKVDDGTACIDVMLDKKTVPDQMEHWEKVVNEPTTGTSSKDLEFLKMTVKPLYQNLKKSDHRSFNLGDNVRIIGKILPPKGAVYFKAYKCVKLTDWERVEFLRILNNLYKNVHPLLYKNTKEAVSTQPII